MRSAFVLARRSSLLLACSAVGGAAQTPTGRRPLPSRPRTITWGAFPIDKAPVATRQVGTDRAHRHALARRRRRRTSTRPTFLAKYGVKPDEILKDVLDFWAARATLRQPGTGGGHVLTGPIYVEGAEPGDMLEVQILALRTRVPYGMNSTGPTAACSATTTRDARRATRRSRLPRQPRHLYPHGHGERQGRRVLLRRASRCR